MEHILAKDLRNAVLQAAFSGHLTERLPSDCDVNEYLRDLQAQRIDYEKTYKDKKHKSLWEDGEYETNFDIPDEWQWAYVGDIFRHNAGKALNAKNTNGKKRKYITTSNVYSDHFELENLKEMYYTDDEVDKCSVKKGDIIVLEGGDCGRTALWDLDESYCIQNHLHRLRPFGECNIRYFFYLLSFYKEAGYTKGKGIAIQGLSANALHNIIIPVCSPEEQTRIVTRIDELMAKIDEYEKIESQLVQLKEEFPGDMRDAILQAAMQGKLTSKENTKEIDIDDVTFEFPESWNIEKCEKLNLMGTKVEKYDGKKKYYSTGSINNNIYTPEGEYTFEEKPSRAGRIAILNTIIEAKMMNTVKATIIDKDLEGSLLSTGFFQIGTSEEYLQKFIKYYLLSPLFISQKTEHCSGTTQKALNDKNLEKLIVPLPPIEEQQRIVDLLDKVLPLCDIKKDGN